VLIAGNHAISGVGITPLSRHKRGRQPALLYIKWRRQRINGIKTPHTIVLTVGSGDTQLKISKNLRFTDDDVNRI
jgi:hypothetical protein